MISFLENFLGIAVPASPPRLAISTLKEKPMKLEEPVDEETDLEDIQDDILDDDGFSPDLLGTPLVEEIEPSNPPKGFFKIISAGESKLLRKSTALWTMCKTFSKVSTDRLRRFIEEKKSTRPNANHITLGNYIKIKINGTTEIAQVLGFKYLTVEKP